MMKFHPASELFPLLEGQEFEDFVADVGINGQLEPITLHEGMVLDGRNVYRACLKVGLTPRFQTWAPTPACSSVIAFVCGRNLWRRHLDTNARAMLAANLAEMLEEEQRQRKQAGLPLNLTEGRGETKRTTEAAARIAKVSPSTARDARKVKGAGTPELQSEVNAGKIPVYKAAKLAELPPEQQLEEIARENAKVKRSNAAAEEADRKSKLVRSISRCVKLAQALDWPDVVGDLVAAQRKAEGRAKRKGRAAA